MRDDDRLVRELKPNIPRDVHASVLERFLILGPVGLFEPFASLKVGAEVSQILSAFESNLRAAVNVGSMPLTFVQHAQHDLMFSRILAAECIRQLDDTGGDLTARQREAARAIALEKIAVVDRQRELTENIVHELHQFLVDRSLGFLADELLRQTAVMIWGALEVLATDLTRHVLNRVPKLASDVLASDPFKRHFSPRGIPIDVL
ncbi:MAG: hypothetical protein K0R41_3926, partial [Geminicoccaceae bacterium]|nr:hypothetical protein [Geminicoccaceae bacterium]